MTPTFCTERLFEDLELDLRRETALIAAGKGWVDSVDLETDIWERGTVKNGNALEDNWQLPEHLEGLKK